MDTSYVVLGFCLLAWVYAQPDPEPTNIFYDIGTGIFNDGSEVVTSDSDFRSLCSVGSTFYHTEGRNLYRNGSFFREADFTIQAIACCCNFIAIAYKDDNNNTMVSVTELESSPSITIKLNLEATGGVALEFFKNGSDTFLFVLSKTTLFKYDADALTEGDVVTVSGLTLATTPRCVSSYYDSSTMMTYIFVSFNTLSGLRLTFDGDQVTESGDFSVPGADTPIGAFPGGLSCVDIEDEYIYFVVSLVGGTGTLHELARYPITTYVPTLPTTTTSQSRADVEVVASGVQSIPGNSAANGLSVCGSSCQSSSTCDATCSCESPCGVCFSGGNGQCQCPNSLQANCCYSDSDDAASCRERIPRINAFCMVKNHVAPRRSGGPVVVVGVTNEELRENITEKRIVNTGRWKMLPSRTHISRMMDNLRVEGFMAEVPGQARGKRYGTFAMGLFPANTSLLDEWIPCISTERSGFLNVMFTVTVNLNESVTLKATFNRTRLDPFMSTLRWRYTAVNGDTMTTLDNAEKEITECRGRLQCTVSGERGTAVYECYRPRRVLRTWHPIFMVMSSGCPAGKYNPPTCDNNCDECVHGVCDDLTGLCNCYPGFHGDNCNSSCDPGLIGRQCDISCEDVFSGCKECRNMLICPAGNVGCQCYPGLRSPFCDEACPEGRWGTNCMETCDPPCNPRTGGAM